MEDKSSNKTNFVYGLNVEGSKVERFGGLIGMFKVTTGGNQTLSVIGHHEFPFTINTIENENYYDAESTQDYEESDGKTYLIAQAFYINLDNFEISGSEDTSLYDGVADYNPLLGKDLSFGWSKEYTGFKTIQRCIPSEKNNNKWDSIATVYDASFIKYVATINNLGLQEADLQYNNESTHKVEKDTKKGYTFNEYRKNSDGDYLKADGNKLSASEQTEFWKYAECVYDYICYTIYEESEGDPTLYSPIGIASVSYSDKDNEGYLMVENDNGKAWQKALGFVVGIDMPQMHYIDAYNVANGLQGLTYFKWGYDNKWTTYKEVGNGHDTTYQHGGGENSHEVAKSLAIFVKDYHYPDGDLRIGDDGKEISMLAEYQKGTNIRGAYFIFQTIFDNLSTFKLLEGQSGITLKESEVYSPKSGSIFDVCGYSSSEGYLAQQKSPEGLSNTQKASIGVSVAIDGLLLIGSFFTGGAVGAAGAAAKQAVMTTARKLGSKAAKTVLKKAIKKGVAKAVAKSIAKSMGKTLLKQGAKIFASTFVIITLANISSSSSNFSKYSAFERKDQDFGVISQSYNRQILIQNGEVKAQSDDFITDEDGNNYLYCSNDRPSDYYSQYYIGTNITTLKNHSSINESNASNYTFMKTFSQAISPIKTISADDVKEWSEDSPYTVKFNNSEEWLVDEGDLVYIETSTESGTNYYSVIPKYIYLNGSYYINEDALTDLTIRPIQLGFSNIKDDSGDVQRNANYYYDGYYYVYGTYKDEEYKLGATTEENGVKITTNNYPGNELKYIEKDGKKYYTSVSGEEIIESSNFKMMVDKTVSFSYNSYWNDEIAKGYINGYDYIQGAYYAPVKKPEEITEELTNDLTRFATYTYAGSKQPTTGNEGHDYIKFDIPSFSYYLSGEDGEQVLKSFSGGTVYFTLAKVETISSQKGEFNDIDKVQYYNDYSGQTLTSELELESVAMTELKINIYPTTFKNPYANNINNVKDSYYYVNTSDEGFSIKQDVVYYYFDGGYTVDNNNIYTLIPNNTHTIDENTSYNDYDLFVVTIDNLTNNANNSNGKFTYNNLIENWSAWIQENKTYLGLPLTEFYDVKGDKVYQKRSDFMFDNGVVCEVTYDMQKINGESSYNFNKYLADSDYQLYTRFKYVDSNGQIIDMKKSWPKIEFVYNSDGELVKQNGFVWSTNTDENKQLFSNNNIVFVERVKVVLGGGQELKKIASGTSASRFDKSGTINII